MFSVRSCAEKPRSRLRPARSVSPSSSTGEPPLLNSLRSTARASVDFPAAGNAAIDLDHQASGAGIVGVGIGGKRMRQRNVDLADMIARDRFGLHARELAGIDGLLDWDDGGAGFPCAGPDAAGGAARG